MKRLLLAALLAATAMPSLATAAPKARLAPLPPYAGAYQPQGVDERGLWMQFDEGERQLRDSEFIIRNPALSAYLQRILCDTVGQERCAAVRIYAVRSPAFNASMAPNGWMLVYSGLLLRVRSEAELAAVLAHEFAHFEERHSLASFKARRSATDVLAWLGVASFYGGIVPSGTQVSMVGALQAFSRDQERAADLRAFDYLAASRYRPGASADIWRRVMDEADATTSGRHQRSTRYDRTPFFASHPTHLERATTLQAMAAKHGDDGEDRAEDFAAAMAEWRPQFLADQVKLNDFGGSDYLIGQLAAAGWTPDLLVARGELHRLRGNPRDLVAAAGFYRDAIGRGSTDPVAHRGLGMALMRSGQAEAGRQSLATYLRMKPDAQDAAMLRLLIEEE